MRVRRPTLIRRSSDNVGRMDLGALFDLEPHGPDTFVGSGPRYPWGGLYGGQIVAQALRAAASTVDEGMAPHSLRAYFIRRGDPAEPVRYEVDRIRNGRSFCTRRVVARQAIGAILNLEASFQVPETTDEIQTVQMPAGIALPTRPDDGNFTTSYQRAEAVAPSSDTGPVLPGRILAWMRVADEVAPDQLLHRCWLAYMSDDLPTDSVRRAIAQRVPAAGEVDEWWNDSFAASLDHTIWFHRPIQADQWHLYDVACHGYIAGRGLAVGHVFTAEGSHVATVAQEVLIRRRG